MKIFWLLFILALLFVIGSAGALRYFGNKPTADKKNDPQD
jgi:hypothetical protein